LILSRAILFTMALCLILFFHLPGIKAQRDFDLLLIPVDSISQVTLKKEKLYFRLADSASVIKKMRDFSLKWIKNNFLAFSYDSIVWDNDNVKAYLSTGPSILLDSITIHGIPKNILKLAGIKLEEGKILSTSFRNYIEIRKNLIRYYENHGFPFASVSIKNIEFKDQHLNAELHVSENGLFVIDSIIVKGGPRISRKYLLNCLHIKSGQTFNQSKIDNISKIISDLSFIKQIKPSETEFTEGKSDLFLYIKSNPANFFNGMIGLENDSISNSGLQLSGDVSLVLQNSFRIGDRIDFYWSKYSSGSQNLRLGFNFPYIFILPLGFNTKLGLEKNELDYLNTDFYVAFNYNYFWNNGFKAFFQKRKSFVIDNKLSGEGEFSGYSSTTAGLGFTLENTDYRVNPTKGFNIEAYSGYGNTINDGEESQSLIEIGFEGAFYLKLSKMISLSLQNHSSALIGPSGFYQNQLFKIGGINILRGFDEKSIFASSYSVFSIEPKLNLGKNSAFFLFSDIGWYQAKQVGNISSDTPFGFGTGMNIDTKAGIFKLIYAVGKQQGNPVKLSNSKVHFGYSARF
jgi:outer membrane protein assembly factor BamA